MKKLFLLFALISISFVTNATIIVMIKADQCRNEGYLHVTPLPLPSTDPNQEKWIVYCTDPGPNPCQLSCSAVQNHFSNYTDINTAQIDFDAIFATIINNISNGTISGTIVISNNIKATYFQTPSGDYQITIDKI